MLGGRSPATGGVPLAPGICAGTSAGSFNAALLVSRLDQYGPAAVGVRLRFRAATAAAGALAPV